VPKGRRMMDRDLRRRKRRKNQGVFNANNLDIILTTVLPLFVIYVSQSIMLPLLVTCIKLPSPQQFYMDI
jgi:hypothetical protein